MYPGGIAKRGQASPVVLASAFVAALAATTALSLSDRAPVMARDAALRLDVADEIHAMSLGVDPELVAHGVAWGGLALLVGLATGVHRIWRTLGLVWLVGVSVLVEEGQRRFTAVRSFEGRDIAANVIGVLVAHAVLLVVLQRRGGAVDRS